MLLNDVVNLGQFKTRYVTGQWQTQKVLSGPAIAEEKYQAKPLDASVASHSSVQHSISDRAETPIWGEDVKVEPKQFESVSDFCVAWIFTFILW